MSILALDTAILNDKIPSVKLLKYFVCKLNKSVLKLGIPMHLAYGMHINILKFESYLL